MYALEYLIINAYSEMLIFIINIIRSIIFYKISDNVSNNKWIFTIFIIISIVCGKIVYKNIFDILPIIASILTVIFTELLIIFSTIFALLRLNYNVDFEKIIIKYYIKIVLKANEEDINFSNNLPKIKFLTIYKIIKNKI